MLPRHFKRVRQLAAGASVAFLLALTGCGAFFQCEGKSDCGTGTTSTGTGDYVYVSNSTTGSSYINGYEVSSSGLTALSGSPYSLGYIPVAMAVSLNDKFLYVAAAPGSSSPGVYMYTLSTSTGVASGGTIENSDLVGAMALSPDGDFLFDVASTTGVISEYSINSSTGALTLVNTFATSTLSGASTNCAATTATPVSQSCSIAVSPEDNYVAVALNANGVNVFPYSSSGGITSATYTQISLPSGYYPYSLAYDGSSYLYVASSGSSTSEAALFTYSAASTAYSNFYSYATGSAVPRSVALSPSYGYLYTANEGNSYIQAFILSSGTPTAISSAGFLGPSDVSAVGVDRSGTYVLAAGYNTTNGLQQLTIASTSLTALASTGTSATTSVPVVLALTH